MLIARFQLDSQQQHATRTRPAALDPRCTMVSSEFSPHPIPLVVQE